MRWLTRIRRRVIAIVSLGGLLFAHAAIAASVCEMLAPMRMDDCMEVDGHNTAICHAHCDLPKKNALDRVNLPVIAQAKAPVLTFLFIIPDTEEFAIAAEESPTRTGSPPHSILHCSLLT